MSTKKQRIKIVHKPKVKDILLCLASMPSWCVFLCEHEPDKEYSIFLRRLVDNRFFNEDARITVKTLAEKFNTSPTKVTSWCKQAYEAIFKMNADRPDLFDASGIRVSLSMHAYDNYCFLNVCLPVVPRELESFRFYFVRARMNTDYFWVKTVEYVLGEEGCEINVDLEHGFVNRYRQFLLDRAFFEEKLGFADQYELMDFQIDEQLKKWYR